MRGVGLARSGEGVAATGGPTIRLAAILQVALLGLVVTNLGRIPLLNLGDREAPLLVNDLAVLAVLAAGAMATLRAGSLRFNDAALAACVFVAIGALSAVAGIPRFGLSGFELTASLAYLARWVVYFGLYVVIINCVRERDVRPVWTALERAMLLFAAFGVVQSIFLPNFALTVYPDARPYYDYDPQGQRLVSTVLEPNIAAAMILIVLLVELAQLASGVRVRMWKPMLLFLALLMTISRSGALAFLVGAAVILAVRGLGKRALKFAALAVAIGLATLPFLWNFIQTHSRFGVSDDSAAARLITWQRAFATFWENKWFGVGFNTYGFVQERQGFERFGGGAYSADGGLLFVAVMTGLVGLVAYSLMLWLAVRTCRRVWRDPDAAAEERGLAIGTAAATIAVVVHSIFGNSLLTPYVMEPMWVLWGLVFVVATTLRRRRSAAAA